jgi:23S rRNA (guanosine2251-2'-O)-methyltransferase
VADSSHVVYGLHAAEAVLQRRGADVRGAAVLAGEARGKLAELIAKLSALQVPLVRAGRDELDRRARGGVHQGIVLDVPPPRELGQNELDDLVVRRGRDLRLLVLDQVEDPRNLGACLRTADAAGADAVVVPRSHSAKLGGTALKAATGAAETVPIAVVPNLARALRSLKDAGVWVIGTDESGQKSLFETEIRPPVALVLGAEGRGLRRLTLDTCDEIVRIPMQGVVESLNVSVAAGIALFELLRQDLARRRV